MNVDVKGMLGWCDFWSDTQLEDISLTSLAHCMAPFCHPAKGLEARESSRTHGKKPILLRLGENCRISGLYVRVLYAINGKINVRKKTLRLRGV